MRTRQKWTRRNVSQDDSGSTIRKWGSLSWFDRNLEFHTTREVRNLYLVYTKGFLPAKKKLVSNCSISEEFRLSKSKF